MSSYTIPMGTTFDEVIEALLPPVEVIEDLYSVETDGGVSLETLEWLERVAAFRKSQQAEPTQPELLRVAERGAY